MSYLTPSTSTSRLLTFSLSRYINQPILCYVKKIKAVPFYRSVICLG